MMFVFLFFLISSLFASQAEDAACLSTNPRLGWQPPTGSGCIKLDHPGLSHLNGVYNPSFIKLPDGSEYDYLIAFRASPYCNNPEEERPRVNEYPQRRDYIQFAHANKSFEIQKLAGTINFFDETRASVEDPRLFMYEGHVYCTYVHCSRDTWNWRERPSRPSEGAKTHLARLHQTRDGSWRIHKSTVPNVGKNLSYPDFEKNWTFSVTPAGLFLSYQFDPICIMQVSIDRNCELSVLKTIEYPRAITQWAFGGQVSNRTWNSTPLMPVANRYVGFFHSSLTKDFPYTWGIGKMRTYALGAALFDETFQIIAYTRNPLVVDFDTELSSTGQLVHCLLPFGGEISPTHFVLSCGVNDRAAVIARLPIDHVLTQMTKI